MSANVEEKSKIPVFNSIRKNLNDAKPTNKDIANFKNIHDTYLKQQSRLKCNVQKNTNILK